MRSGRGKCPQCKEMIVLDLDAAELRCPFCNALLKQSAKTVAEVRAEQEAAAAAAAVAMPATEEVSASQEIVEPAPDVSAPETEPSEPRDEAGISEEELAMMDATVPEEKAADEASSEAEDEIGISDEELAMMDATVPEETTAEEAPAEDDPVLSDRQSGETPVAEATDEPLVFGSISADENDQTPEEAAAEGVADEEDAPLAEEEEAPVNNNISLEDDMDPALLDEDLPLIEDAAPEAAAEETLDNEVAAEETLDNKESESAEALPDEPVAEAAEESAPLEVEDAAPTAVEDEAPSEEPAALEVEDAPSASLEIEEPAAEETPAEEAPYVPTEEDMAFAASLSETKRTPSRVGFVSPNEAAEPAEKKEKKAKRAPKEAAAKGEKSMGGSSIYKKPIAVIMMILSILAAAVWFLYYKTEVFLLISADLATTIAEALPTFGDAMTFPSYVIAAITGLIAVTSILGLTGKKGKLGFLFVLLADLVYALVALFGATPIVEIEALQKIVVDYGEYAMYAIYGLVLLAAIFFAISFGTDKEDYDFSAAGAILPIIYMVVVIAGYAASILLPMLIEDFSLSADIVRYAILGVLGVTLLLTLVGVHRGTLSRAANGWLIFATLLTIAVVNAVPVVIAKFVPEAAIYVHSEIPYFLTPIIAIFGVAGFTAADLRN